MLYTFYWRILETKLIVYGWPRKNFHQHEKWLKLWKSNKNFIIILVTLIFGCNFVSHCRVFFKYLLHKCLHHRIGNTRGPPSVPRLDSLFLVTTGGWLAHVRQFFMNFTSDRCWAGGPARSGIFTPGNTVNTVLEFRSNKFCCTAQFVNVNGLMDIKECQDFCRQHYSFPCLFVVPQLGTVI